jgi:hypothetical protein
VNKRIESDEQAHGAEAQREPAGQRHGNRVRDRERSDDPGDLRRGGAEIAADRRQRDVRDRRVQHVHEGRERERKGAEDSSRHP